jgi:hypothetical protein
MQTWTLSMHGYKFARAGGRFHVKASMLMLIASKVTLCLLGSGKHTWCRIDSTLFKWWTMQCKHASIFLCKVTYTQVSQWICYWSNGGLIVFREGVYACE